MTELTNVLEYLRESEKGRLVYDREDRILAELELDIDKLTLKSNKGSQKGSCIRSSRINASSLDRPVQQTPATSATPPSSDHSTTKIVQVHPNSSARSSPAPLLISNNSPKLPFVLEGNKSFGSPASPLTPSTPANRSLRLRHEVDETMPSFGSSSSLSLGRNELKSPITTSVSTTPKSALTPLRVCVNRSSERGLERKLVPDPKDSSTPKDRQQKIKSSSNDIFYYSPGFLERISKTTVSVDLIKLRLDNIQQYLGSEDGKGDFNDENQNRSDVFNDSLEDEDDYEQDLEIERFERKMAYIREKNREETDRLATERLQLFRNKSREFAEEAEKKYMEEIKWEKEKIKKEEEQLLIEVQMTRERMDREIAEDVAANEKRRTEMKQFLQSCRDQENKFKAEEAKSVRIKEQTERFNTVYLPSLKESVVRLMDLWTSIEDKDQLSKESVNAVGIYEEFMKNLDSMKMLISEGSATDAHWDNLRALQEKIAASTALIEKDLQDIEARKVTEAAEQKAEAAAKVAAAAAAAAEEKKKCEIVLVAAEKEVNQQQQQQSQQQQQQPILEIAQPASSPVQSNQYSTSYQAMLDFKSDYIKEVAFADSEKKIKTELTLVISTALNAISAQTTDHLNKKLENLTFLLSGKPITVKEQHIVSAANHPSGIRFCMGMLAKKIVRQGEDVMSSKAEAAFSFASVSLALWDNFPDFGKLLLAYFYEFCPLLAPHIPLARQDQADKDYYKALGYKYDDKGVIEKQDMYLKRMTGLARLFAAISASHKPQGSSTDHPLGPKTVWHYLSTLVNLKPVPDLTATLLLVMLEITGNMMIIRYKSQFFKLLLFIKSSYLPQLEAVKTDGGPTSRLDTFLTKILQDKRIDPPKGILPRGFVKKINL